VPSWYVTRIGQMHVEDQLKQAFERVAMRELQVDRATARVLLHPELKRRVVDMTPPRWR
jgi:aminoglycoside/choline kinase family phosphotransferase